MWDVDTSDILITADPGSEISEKVYEQLEAAISDLISNAVNYSIQQSLKGSINIRSDKKNLRQSGSLQDK